MGNVVSLSSISFTNGIPKSILFTNKRLGSKSSKFPTMVQTQSMVEQPTFFIQWIYGATFHRPVNIQGQKILVLPFCSVYRYLPCSIQEDKVNYFEAQRYIFQANSVIPPKNWPGEYGSWNYGSSHPHWLAVQKARKDYEQMINANFMQDSQPEENTASFSRRRRIRVRVKDKPTKEETEEPMKIGSKR